MIIFDQVWFSRGDRQVLRGISFSVGTDERVAILGGSGEGKTTILKLILGLVKPDSGAIFVDGEEITSKSEAQLRKIRMKFSIVFQEGALFDSLTVGENVAFPLREYTKMSEEEIEQKVRELLRIVDLEHAIDLMPEELSGGMNRRAAIARSLAACEPEVFLYDEPTGALDPANSQTILKLIEDLSDGGRGFILVSHEVQNAMRVARRFILIKGGVVLFDGDKESFLSSNTEEVRAFAHSTM
jgi:phospholipid/cholesterol/gamma-HCH transport system ATP-binding protein